MSIKLELSKLLYNGIRLVDTSSCRAPYRYKAVVKKTGFSKPKEQFIKQQFHEGVESHNGQYWVSKNEAYDTLQEVADYINKRYVECISSIPLDLELMFCLLRKLRNVQYRIYSYNAPTNATFAHRIDVVRAKSIGNRRVQYCHVTLKMMRNGSIHVVHEIENYYGWKKEWTMNVINPTSPHFVDGFVGLMNRCLEAAKKKVVYSKFATRKWLDYGNQ